MPDQNGSARPGGGIFSLVWGEAWPVLSPSKEGEGLRAGTDAIRWPSPYPLPEGEGNHDLPHLNVIRAASNRDPSSANTPRTSTFASFFRSVAVPFSNTVAEPVTV